MSTVYIPAHVEELTAKLEKQLENAEYDNLIERWEAVSKAAYELARAFVDELPMEALPEVAAQFERLMDAIGCGSSLSADLWSYNEEAGCCDIVDTWEQAEYAEISLEECNLSHRGNGKFETFGSDLADMIICCVAGDWKRREYERDGDREWVRFCK